MFVLHFENWRDQNRVQGQALFRDHAAPARSGGADFLVVLAHWGEEYYARPTADQREAAHDLVDAGSIWWWAPTATYSIAR